ncbi:hypothetical protein E4V51_30765, partial [Paenibacillus sp. 28ISP30-2]|nr:hypothetical protein [Paenibacillus sp. 28ISP30-2]
MENMDQRLVSIFDENADTPLVRESLRDVIKLSGGLNELREYFEEPDRKGTVLTSVPVSELLLRLLLGKKKKKTEYTLSFERAIV